MMTCKLPVGSSSGAYLFALGGGAPRYLRTLASVDTGEGYPVDSWVEPSFASGRLTLGMCREGECYSRDVTTYAVVNGQVAKISAVE